MGKIETKDTYVTGWKMAVRGMRAPMQSYELSDSEINSALTQVIYHQDFDKERFIATKCIYSDNVEIGEEDLKLMKRLVKGGSEHAKFLRMIHVQAEFALPRYIWSELDTYKVGTVSNSESTMHKLLNNNNPITEDQFYYGDDPDTGAGLEVRLHVIPVIQKLEDLRLQYKGLKKTEYSKNELLVIAKRILPECFIQKRVWDANYQTIWNMYKQRVISPHRLKEEWIDTFGKWCEELPYFKELFLEDN